MVLTASSPSTDMESFSLTIKNNSSSEQQVTLFDLYGKISNGDTITFAWDLTQDLANAVIFNFDRVNILSKGTNPTAPYSNFVYINPAGTFTDVIQVVAGLNTMGLGNFTNPSANLISIDTTTNLFSSIVLSALYPSNLIAGGPNFAIDGSFIYDAGFGADLSSGNLVRIPTSNLFWTNAFHGLSAGPFNRSALWSSDAPVNTTPLLDIGVFANVVATEAKTVYLGFSTIGEAAIYVNNSQVINISGSDAGPIFDNINAVLGTTLSGALFNLWAIVPIDLVVGDNIIQFIAASISGGTTPAALGLEVYDNTPAEITAATSYADLNLLYTSSDFIPANMF